jgi:hypothetical protein
VVTIINKKRKQKLEEAAMPDGVWKSDDGAEQSPRGAAAAAAAAAAFGRCYEQW